ncbi:hypothetical protein KAR91_26430, partial [Candidatus Pacearchaeota archaeon]|nr:hypothetical protein [Candidatus Pacearchaeota archaeon]
MISSRKDRWEYPPILNPSFSSSLRGNEAVESETVMEKVELKGLEIGHFVRYCSEDRQWYNALITAI